MATQCIKKSKFVGAHICFICEETIECEAEDGKSECKCETCLAYCTCKVCADDKESVKGIVAFVCSNNCRGLDEEDDDDDYYNDQHEVDFS